MALLAPPEGSTDTSGQDYVLAPDAAGKGRYRWDCRKAFRAVADAAGVPWLTPHGLRHTFITLLVKKGVPLAKVSQWAGHSSIQVTADIYSHLQGFDEDINVL